MAEANGMNKEGRALRGDCVSMCVYGLVSEWGIQGCGLVWEEAEEGSERVWGTKELICKS